jgi:hypothetical protein
MCNEPHDEAWCLASQSTPRLGTAGGTSQTRSRNDGAASSNNRRKRPALNVHGCQQLIIYIFALVTTSLSTPESSLTAAMSTRGQFNTKNPTIKRICKLSSWSDGAAS